MTTITLMTPDTDTAAESDVARALRPLFRRLAAWRRHRNYPTLRRARREALFSWSADVVRHTSARP